MIIYFYLTRDVTLIVTPTTSLSRLESNNNEGILLIPQSSRIGASLSDGLVSYPEHSFVVEVLLYCKDEVDVSYSLPS